ncbi:Btf3 [Symbiodinium microadriaticum]|nr:Btf3 [Symbiodinium microadriaticum]
MIAKRFGGNVNGAATGGGGAARRKKKAVHKSAGTDDKKLTATLKKMGVQPISGIEEVNFFQDDGNILHFNYPKVMFSAVQASLQSNTYVVSGPGEVKPLQDLLPGILSQMGPESMDILRQMMGAMGGAGGDAAAAETPAGVDADEDIPDLVGNFEDASNK